MRMPFLFIIMLTFFPLIILYEIHKDLSNIKKGKSKSFIVGGN